MRVPTAVLVLFMLVVTGCATSVRSSQVPQAGVPQPQVEAAIEADVQAVVDADGSDATATPTPDPLPTAQRSEDEPTPPPALSPAGAIMSRSGIPVALLAKTSQGFIVRTPCGRFAIISGGELLRDIAVVLDPGHGGPIDTGTVGPNGLVERDLNLDLAVATETELEVRGVAVVLTRTSDYHTTLFTRSALADSLNAEIMVSIHHNAPAAAPSLIPGTEVFIQDGSSKSRRLGGLLWERVSAALATVEGVEWTRAGDAGVFTVLNTEGLDAYGMIRRPETPTALVELGYLANGSEATFMATPAYIDLAARALTDAIVAYLDTDDPGAGFGVGRVFNPNAAPGQDVCVDAELG